MARRRRERRRKQKDSGEREECERAMTVRRLDVMDISQQRQRARRERWWQGEEEKYRE